MEFYNDETNEKGIFIIFVVAQMFFLLIVYLFIYSSYMLIDLAVQEDKASAFLYIPVFLAFIAYPFLLSKYRKIFKSGKRILAVKWTVGMASAFILGSYYYVLTVV